mmetsp:Transcript_6390/g.39859  ORF Transcript_6390/g.39859 Transcript_6390/m.39859 type:complete len:195 (+) Transcript_6390:444-1028(+)
MLERLLPCSHRKGTALPDGALPRTWMFGPCAEEFRGEQGSWRASPPLQILLEPLLGGRMSNPEVVSRPKLPVCSSMHCHKHGNTGHNLRLWPCLLLGMPGGGAQACPMQNGAEVAGEEQCRERKFGLDLSQLKAVPQMQETNREEPRLHAHDLLRTLSSRILLALPRAMAQTRRANRRSLPMQSIHQSKRTGLV